MTANGRNDLKLHSVGDAEEKEVLQKKKAKENDEDALDVILSHAGEFGTYQKWLFASMFPFALFAGFTYFVQMFVTATPQNHWCHVPELAHLDPEFRRNLSIPRNHEGEWERCEVFAANWSAVLESLAPPAPSTARAACAHGWDFEYEDIPYPTVTSERNWVCDQAGLAPLAQSLYFMGSIIGGIVFGLVADRIGRVPALIGSCVAGCVGSVASAFTRGFFDFALCRFIVGFSYDSCFMILYILVLEYTGPRHRSLVANLSIALFFGAACLSLPWLALWLADWRVLLVCTALPGLVVIAAPWFLPESARWLLSQGRVNKAIDILHRFEKINKTKIPEDILEDFITSSHQTDNSNEGIKDLLKSGPLRLMALYMMLVYMSCALLFDGLVRMSETLGLNFFLTFTLASATETPSVLMVAFLLDRWGRRWLTAGPVALAGVCTFIAAFVSRGVASVTLAVMARFCINMAICAAVQWVTELLPTGVRATASSMIRSSAYLATMMSPFVVYSERIWRPLPLLILSGIAMVGGGFSLMLPETKNRPMPQTIADGEKIIRSHTLCGTKEDIQENKWPPTEDHKDHPYLS